MMRISVLYPVCLSLILVMLSGCWNYREIEQFSIVAGIAVDKSEGDEQFELTAEIIELKGKTDEQPASKVISVTGNTMFDAARNAISSNNRRLYWSHSKVVLISPEVAREGVARIIDWYNRDSETRPDVNILITKTEKARDILKGAGLTDTIFSFELEQMISNQRSLEKSPNIEIWNFINTLEAEGIAPVVPLINIIESDDKNTPSIGGSAVFKRDRLVGQLNGEETKYSLFARDEIRGGVLTQKITYKNQEMKISLEIFSNNTQRKPAINDQNEVEMNLEVETVVALDEIQGVNLKIQESDIEEIQKIAEKSLEQNITSVIQKVQSEYQSDIFGFGNVIKKQMPRVWKQIGKDWDQIFPELDVKVQCRMRIKNTAMSSRTITMGD